MKITKSLNYAMIAAVIVSALSFAIKIIPCKTSPVIAKPEYTWNLCKLPNPFSETILGVSSKFFGLSTDPLSALVFGFIAVFLLVFLGLNLFKKKKGKVVNLTSKK